MQRHSDVPLPEALSQCPGSLIGDAHTPSTLVLKGRKPHLLQIFRHLCRLFITHGGKAVRCPRRSEPNHTSSNFRGFLPRSTSFSATRLSLRRHYSSGPSGATMMGERSEPVAAPHIGEDLIADHRCLFGAQAAELFRCPPHSIGAGLFAVCHIGQSQDLRKGPHPLLGVVGDDHHAHASLPHPVQPGGNIRVRCGVVMGGEGVVHIENQPPYPVPGVRIPASHR